MKKVIVWLNGKKTYLLGLAVIVWGLYNHFFGEKLGWDATITSIFDGSLIMTVRAALAKVGLSTTPTT